MRKSLIKAISIFLVIMSPKGLIAQMTDSLCQDSSEGLCDAGLPQALPTGCQDYNWEASSPKNSADPLEQLLKAKIIILGETHEKCDEAGRSCVKSLLEMKAQKKNKKINRSKTAILFEEWGQGDKVLCKEYGFDEVSRDCGGWNIESEKHKKIQQLVSKAQIMEKIHSDFTSHWLSLAELESVEESRSMAYIFVDSYIESLKTTVIENTRICEQFKKKHGKKNPNLRSKKCTNLEILIFWLQQAEKFFEKSKEDPKVLDNILVDIATEADKYIEPANQHLGDPEALIKIPNRAMLWAINSKATEKETIFVIAGMQHTNKTSPHNQELYDGLNEHADKNPYVVLSCKL
jgi:hypothetical protein